jgi:hypothetical protein
MPTPARRATAGSRCPAFVLRQLGDGGLDLAGRIVAVGLDAGGAQEKSCEEYALNEFERLAITPSGTPSGAVRGDVFLNLKSIEGSLFLFGSECLFHGCLFYLSDP